jgi:transcriptional regulator with XRE-family HTH domain
MILTYHIMDYRKIGYSISVLRASYGWTQKQLARKVDIDQTYLSKIETGNIEQPISRALARRFGEQMPELGTEQELMYKFGVASKNDVDTIRSIIAVAGEEFSSMLELVKQGKKGKELYPSLKKITDLISTNNHDKIEEIS